MLKYLKIGIINMAIATLSGVNDLSLSSPEYWYKNILTTVALFALVSLLEHKETK